MFGHCLIVFASMVPIIELRGPYSTAWAFLVRRWLTHIGRHIL